MGILAASCETTALFKHVSPFQLITSGNLLLNHLTCVIWRTKFQYLCCFSSWNIGSGNKSWCWLRVYQLFRFYFIILTQNSPQELSCMLLIYSYYTRVCCLFKIHSDFNFIKNLTWSRTDRWMKEWMNKQMHAQTEKT